MIISREYVKRRFPFRAKNLPTDKVCAIIFYMENIKNEIRKNEIYAVRIDGYSSEAFGVCRIGGRAVFVPKTLAGEEWDIRIVKVTAGAVYARPERLITASPERRDVQCPYFGKCGGCDTWHMSYDEELRFKLGRVNDALTRIGGQTVTAGQIIGADSFMHYRNKGILAVADIGGRPRAGFYRERSHELIAVNDCLIQNELCRRAAEAVTEFMSEHGIPAYDEQSGRGVVRHIFCRRAYHTADAVVCIVAARGFGAHTEALTAALRRACPELTGIVLNENKSSGNTVLCGSFYTLWGRASMSDILCGSRFDISPQAFYQVNPPQAERLYSKALEYAAPGGDSLVLDLYCGAGTISLCLAAAAGRVIGAEIVPQAVENARENAARNGFDNVEFICADAAEAAEQLAGRALRPEVIVVDPPRKGMAEDAVRAVASMQPERIVYVSCDPATLARDVLRFAGLGYGLKAATEVDMFPRTCHVETVCLLVLRNPVTHINIDVDVEEMVQDKRGLATYGQIKDYVLEQNGLKVSSLYIAQVKQKHGIIERDNYNKPKSEDVRQPQCPPDKERAITEALKHFGMI